MVYLFVYCKWQNGSLAVYLRAWRVILCGVTQLIRSATFAKGRTSLATRFQLRNPYL